MVPWVMRASRPNFSPAGVMAASPSELRTMPMISWAEAGRPHARTDNATRRTATNDVCFMTSPLLAVRMPIFLSLPDAFLMKDICQRRGKGAFPSLKKSGETRIRVACPCCGSTLTIDAGEGTVREWKEAQDPRKAADLKDAEKLLREERGRVEG